MGMIRILLENDPNSKVHGAHMGPIWGQQDPSGPHVGPMNLAIWDLGLTNVGTLVEIVARNGIEYEI